MAFEPSEKMLGPESPQRDVPGILLSMVLYPAQCRAKFKSTQTRINTSENGDWIFVGASTKNAAQNLPTNLSGNHCFFEPSRARISFPFVATSFIQPGLVFFLREVSGWHRIKFFRRPFRARRR